MERIKLDPEDIQKLNDLDPDIEFLNTEIARAKRAGIDVTKLEKDLNDIIQLRKGLIREYGEGA